jgi:hypothetical protein
MSDDNFFVRQCTQYRDIKNYLGQRWSWFVKNVRLNLFRVTISSVRTIGLPTFFMSHRAIVKFFQ